MVLTVGSWSKNLHGDSSKNLTTYKSVTSLKKNRRKKPVTIVVGIKCNDGVVVASDSQAEFGRGVDVKRLNANKIHTLDQRYSIAGAGVLAHIRLLVENVGFFIRSQQSRQRSELNRDESEKMVEQALWALVKHYNIDRANILGISERDFFHPMAIFAGREKNGNNLKFYSFILYGQDGTVEPLDDYGAAGSGAAYAELLLKGLYYPEIMVDEALKVAIYVINEVKSIDPHCGGDTQVAILKATSTNGEIRPHLEILPQSQITSISMQIKPLLDLIRTECVSKILRGEIDETRIREIIQSS